MDCNFRLRCSIDRMRYWQGGGSRKIGRRSFANSTSRYTGSRGEGAGEGEGGVRVKETVCRCQRESDDVQTPNSQVTERVVKRTVGGRSARAAAVAANVADAALIGWGGVYFCSTCDRIFNLVRIPPCQRVESLRSCSSRDATLTNFLQGFGSGCLPLQRQPIAWTHARMGAAQAVMGPSQS
jgi:hypothetical protein